MKLLYVKSFSPKESGLPDIKPNRVYQANEDDDSFILDFGGTPFTIDKTSQTGPRFDADIVEITSENYDTFQYNSEDSKKVLEYLIRPKLDQIARKIEKEHQEVLDQLNNNLKYLASDMPLTAAITDVTTHIIQTMGDKYEVSQEADLSGLMRGSPHSPGFNVGNALKYCKRYLSSGFAKSNNVEDLHKAIHYLLMEVISHPTQNEK